jgi:hypothetical protein
LGTCPARTTTRNTPLDCDDHDKDVHPGQTNFFDSGAGAAGDFFDYDCNGTVEKRAVGVGGTIYTTIPACYHGGILPSECARNTYYSFDATTPCGRAAFVHQCGLSGTDGSAYCTEIGDFIDVTVSCR